MNKLPSRHPNVEHRRLALTERDAESQIRKGLYVVERGERFAVPVDSVRDRRTYHGRTLWAVTDGRVHRPGVRFTARGSTWQRKTLAFLRDHVHKDVPYWYYMAMLGHDLHVSTYGNLFARHWHAGWANPIDPDRLDAPFDADFATLRDTHFVPHACDLPACPASVWPSWDACLASLRSQRGFVEDLGWLSGAKVTDAFVSEEIDELVSATSSEYADFDFHEVGTDNTAEDNDDTALGVTSGIARATGSPTDSDPDYVNVGTVTADATETWEEHGLFNNSTSVALMDRSLTGGQAVNSSDQVAYTYTLSKAAEA
jgi:hypothetical protein